VTAWYVVYTKVNSEAMALEHLRRQNYTAYLPKYQKWRRHARRREWVARPLFPRYLFVALDIAEQRWRPILSTVGVCDVLRRGDLPAPVPTGLIEEIQERERDNATESHSPLSCLREGDEVLVINGPFADLVGRIHNIADRERVCLLLNLLGRQVKTCLSGDIVVPV